MNETTITPVKIQRSAKRRGIKLLSPLKVGSMLAEGMKELIKGHAQACH
jgi:hypothetical protein